MRDGVPPTVDPNKWPRQMFAITEELQQFTNFHSFLVDGTGHCHTPFSVVMHSNDNASFVSWAEKMILGLNVSSVDCGEACQTSGVQGCDGVKGSGQKEDHCGECNGDGQSCIQD